MEPGAFAYSDDLPVDEERSEGEDEEEETAENTPSPSSCTMPVAPIDLTDEEQVETVTISPCITPLKELNLDTYPTPRRSIRNRRPSGRVVKNIKEENVVKDDALAVTSPVPNRLSAVVEMSPDVENQPPRLLTVAEVLKFSPPTTTIKRKRSRMPTLASISQNSRFVGKSRQRTVSMFAQRKGNNCNGFLKQTSISNFFQRSPVINVDSDAEEEQGSAAGKSRDMEATNELFRSFLANNQPPLIKRRVRASSGRYSLRSGGSSSLISPKKPYSQKA